MPAATHTIPLLDLRAQFRTIRGEVLEAITRVADSQLFILGDEVAALERDLASYCQVEHAIGCASGSDALTLALMALDIGPGDEVLTVPYTFFATAGSIALRGARPVFVDVQPDTFNLDPAQLETALRRHPNIKAIIPVHLFGGCADLHPILDVATRHNIPVIEDAAQAIGAEYKGRRAGSLGVIGCFSFFPTKNLGAFGEGGMLTTNDPQLARRLRALRVHGSEQKYVHDVVGCNSRLDALQAAVLRVKLRHLDSWTSRRQQNAVFYRTLFAEANLPIQIQHQAPYQTRHIYNQFVIRTAHRDAVRQRLQEQGIGTEVYYPIPLHLQRCFEYLGYRAGDFPISEELARTSLALPIHAELEPADLRVIVNTLAAAL